MNSKNRLLKLLMVFSILFTFTNCDIEPVENSADTITLEGQDTPGLATVPIEQTVEYFKSRNNNLYARGEDNLDLEVDLSSIRQAEITNTDAKINLIDATTKFNNVESTVMQIEIDGTVQTILYNVIPENNSQSRSETNSTSRYNFTGNIVITNLSGNVLNNFQYNSGNLLGEINLNFYSTGPDPCWGITCGIDLDTVYLSNAQTIPNWAYTNYANTANVMMNYQFVRSTNNYATMALAYANYYRQKALEENKPCDKDAVKNPEIAPSGGWNINGGRYGMTRNSGEKFHDGTDVKADVNSSLFAMHGGTVTGVIDTFQAGEYKTRSYGNNIEITSTINGVEVKLSYNHLNGVDVAVGDTIAQGGLIGITGDTGNAQTRGGIPVIPHVHIKARKKVNGNWTKTNPENYMGSTFNSDGTSTNTNCN